eukprot:jgi/Tetstr1/439735/TSEL_028154.t1
MELAGCSAVGVHHGKAGTARRRPEPRVPGRYRRGVIALGAGGSPAAVRRRRAALPPPGALRSEQGGAGPSLDELAEVAQASIDVEHSTIDEGEPRASGVEGGGEGGPSSASPLGFLAGRWEASPARSKIVNATLGAFVFSNLDKVILSIAIIPMAQDLGLSPTISGLVQSSFFWGYILVQLPGGYAVAKAGGRRMLPVGVALWSLATAALPVAAATAIPTLCASRAIVGLGQGLAPPSTTELIARTVPDSQRSSAVSKAFSGLHVGSVLSLLAGPALIKTLGWQPVFYIFGAAGLGWCVWWERLLGATFDSGTAQAEKRAFEDAAGVERPAPAPSTSAGGTDELPWRGFLRDPAMQGLMYVHFCNNWFHYTMLAWLPTFYIRTLDLDLIRASQLSLIPPIAAFAFSNIAGPIADNLINGGTRVVTVRKGMQGIAFVGPSLMLLGAAVLEDQHVARIACITGALGLNAFSLAGLYSNHADMSRKYCSILLGITNTAGAVPGIVGVTFTGYMLEKTGDWNLALFFPCILFFVTGFAAYMATGTGDRRPFDQNEPFFFEKWLPQLPFRKATQEKLD